MPEAPGWRMGDRLDDAQLKLRDVGSEAQRWCLLELCALKG